MKQSIGNGLVVLSLTTIMAACGGASSQSTTEKTPTDTTNSEAPLNLNPRVIYQGYSLNLRSNTALSTRRDAAVKFKYLVSAEAPKGEKFGEVLQATNFDFNGKYGFVSYNLAGGNIEGALDIVVIEKDSWADIKATLLFSDMEFSDVKVNGDFAYLVGAQSSGDEGAVMVVVDVSNVEKPQEVSRVSLPGYYATSLVIFKDVAYVTSGDNEGVVLVDLSDAKSPQVKESLKLENALSVIRANDQFYVLGGWDGTWIYSDLDFKSGWQLSRDRSEAPARMAARDQYIFSNAQHSGLSVVDLKADKIVYQESLDGTGNGIDVSGKYIFLAQGDAGLQVAEFNEKEAPQLMGSLDFTDDRGSANQVRFSSENSVIFLADGLGGFRVIAFEAPVVQASRLLETSVYSEQSDISIKNMSSFVADADIRASNGKVEFSGLGGLNVKNVLAKKEISVNNMGSATFGGDFTSTTKINYDTPWIPFAGQKNIVSALPALSLAVVSAPVDESDSRYPHPISIKTSNLALTGNVVLNGTLYVKGNVNIGQGVSFSGHGAIVAEGNITISNLSSVGADANRVFLYSIGGNISIGSTSSVSLYGSLYAPKGNITLSNVSSADIKGGIFAGGKVDLGSVSSIKVGKGSFSRNEAPAMLFQ